MGSPQTLMLVAALVTLDLGEGARANEPVRARAPRAPVRSEVSWGRRAPFASLARTRELVFDRYEQVMTVVRQRSPGKAFAAFSAEPQSLEPGSRMVFEIRSESKEGSIPRWRCVATRDVAECLGAPVRVRYLPGDQRMVLAARLQPKTMLETHELGVAARDEDP